MRLDSRVHGLETSARGDTRTMMSAQDYRARADALEQASLESVDYDLILEVGGIAAQWRTLADLADLQDALRTALQATRNEPSPSRLVDTPPLGQGGT